MGCWNATCNISNLPIFYGDKVVLIPVMKVMDKTRFNTCYPTDNFVPFAFPIIGKYDEYGGIEDIVQDKLNENIIRSFDYLYVYDGCGKEEKNECISITEKSYEQIVNDVLCCHEGVYIKTNSRLHKNGMVEISFMMIHYDLYISLLDEIAKRMPYDSKIDYKHCLLNSFTENVKECEKRISEYQEIIDNISDDKKAFFSMMQEKCIADCADKIAGYGEHLNPCKQGWFSVVRELLDTKNMTILTKFVDKALFTQVLSLLRKGYHCDSGCGSQSQETRLHFVLANYIIERIKNNAVEHNSDVDSKEDEISKYGVEEQLFI